MKVKTINPATEQVIHEYSLLTKTQVDQKIHDAWAQFQTWRRTDVKSRAELMLKMASRLRVKKQDYAKLMASEMGKPLAAGQAEIEKCAWACEFYAEQTETYLKPKLIKTECQKSLVCYQPLGPIFAIMPWNFPFWQVFRFAAPNIMAGNVGLLRHAPISTGTGDAIAALFLEVGYPDHVFQHLIIDNDMTAYVIAQESIKGVTLTGSERAGSIVASQAAKYLKKSVLELGGSDPYVVLKDADLDLAAEQITASRLNNTGQTCIAAKRMIVVEAVAKPLIEKIIGLLANYRVGDPLDPTTTLGPLARADLRDGLHRQVLESVAKGAQLEIGGVIPTGTGYYYPSTVLTNVRPGMPAFDDELFGPVFAFVTAADETEAIRLANTSRYGLGGAVFTRDLKKGEQIAMHEIESGSCVVNGRVSSDPRLPFGGIKHSGFGRELSSEGFFEFMNVKTVNIYG